MEQQNNKTGNEGRGASTLMRGLAPREIKFRAWTGKKMCYSDPNLQGSNGYVELVTIYTGYEDSDEWDDYTFMQHTGLKDQNGNEIYEGDIVSYVTSGLTGKRCECTGYVVYQGDGFTIETGLQIKDSFLNRADQHEIEVIGNIFENPELIP